LALPQKINTDSVNRVGTIFLFPNKSNKASSDSLRKTAAQDSIKPLKTFLHVSPTDYRIKEIPKNNPDSIIYILLVFIFFISLIWYYLPERISSLVNLTFKSRDFRPRENTDAETPGMIILLFLILNYSFAIAFFLFLSTTKADAGLSSLWLNKYFLFYLIGVVGFYIYRLVVIYSTGFIFNTLETALKQLKLYVSVDNLTGILLIPLIFLMLFLEKEILIYSGFLILIFFQIYKWLQTFSFGKSIQGFSMLHLFMYLCTLEIVPLIVLVKLYFIVFD